MDFGIEGGILQFPGIENLQRPKPDNNTD